MRSLADTHPRRLRPGVRLRRLHPRWRSSAWPRSSIDGGSWYQAQRHLQTAADAAALAGAQDLPTQQSARADRRARLRAAQLRRHPGADRDLPRRRRRSTSPPRRHAPGIFARMLNGGVQRRDRAAPQAQAQRARAAPAEGRRADRASRSTARASSPNPSCFGQTDDAELRREPSTRADRTSKFGLLDLRPQRRVRGRPRRT